MEVPTAKRRVAVGCVAFAASVGARNAGARNPPAPTAEGGAEHSNIRILLVILCATARGLVQPSAFLYNPLIRARGSAPPIDGGPPRVLNGGKVRNRIGEERTRRPHIEMFFDTRAEPGSIVR